MSMTGLTEAANAGHVKAKRICVEEHWTNSDLEEITREHRLRTGLPLHQDGETQSSFMAETRKREKDFEAYRLPLMDGSGITMQLLSAGFPGIQGIEKAATAITMARRVNDYQSEIINKFPDQYAGLAAIPLQDPKAAADELERAVTQLGCKGAMIHGHTNGEYLNEQKFWVVWERAESLGVPIYLHISESHWSSKIYEQQPELRRWSWGIEAANHAIKIVFSGVFDDFPKTKLMLGHLGEGLPYLLGRIDQPTTSAVAVRKLKKRPSEYIRDNVIVTTSGNYMPEALICAISALGADSVLFAADYPHGSMKNAVELLENTPISDAVKEKIYHLNAERLFGL